MTLDPTPWTAAFVTVGLSALLALCVALRLPRSMALQHAGQRDKQTDLETRYAQLIAQLRDLAGQQHRLTPVAFAQERELYEQQAQQTLAALQRVRQAVDAASAQAFADATPAVRFLAHRPQLRGALWGAGGMGVVMALVLGLQQYGQQVAPTAAAPQAAGSPPAGPMAAGGPMVAGEGAGPDVDEMKALAEELKTSPSDTAKLLRFAHLLLRAQMLEEAQTINARALQLAPNDLEGLTHAAVLSASSGDQASADIGLDVVLKKDPTFVEAWFFRGMLAMQRGDTARVQESFAAYLEHAPPGAQRDRIASMLARLRDAGS
jgi:tetratricopeptide (TPR) repeat protein